MPTRFFAPLSRDIYPLPTHDPGLPGGLAPQPGVILLDEEPEGCFLITFTRSGKCGGDNWFLSIEDAQKYAAAVYGEDLGTWVPVPDGVGDALSYALRSLPPLPPKQTPSRSVSDEERLEAWLAERSEQTQDR
jgi:hypothetical protein